MNQSEQGKPPFFVPIFCNLTGKKVVVIGGGRVAERKVMSLLPSGAKIEVISPDITSGLLRLAERGDISYKNRPFQKGDLIDAWLVVSATDETMTQDQVFNEATKERCFCNVVDEPDKCSFIVPSIVKRGQLCLAISTGGQSPGLSKALRKKLQEEFGPEWALFVALIGRLRRIIIKDFIGEERKKRLNGLINFEVLEWIKKAKWDKVTNWARDICNDKNLDIDHLMQKDG